MSVLKANRSESKVEFVVKAKQIYIQTIDFLTRLSARYSRLIAGPVAELASEVLDNAEKANTIFPSDKISFELRKNYLLASRASLSALDIHLSHCYDILMLNPEGCFTSSSGKTLSSKEAKIKIGNMAQSLGELVADELVLLTKIIKQDKEKCNF